MTMDDYLVPGDWDGSVVIDGSRLSVVIRVPQHVTGGKRLTCIQDLCLDESGSVSIYQLEYTIRRAVVMAKNAMKEVGL